MITMLHHQRYDNDNIMKSRKLFMMAPPRSQLHRGGGRKSCSRRQLVSPGIIIAMAIIIIIATG